MEASNLEEPSSARDWSAWCRGRSTSSGDPESAAESECEGEGNLKSDADMRRFAGSIQADAANRGSDGIERTLTSKRSNGVCASRHVPHSNSEWESEGCGLNGTRWGPDGCEELADTDSDAHWKAKSLAGSLGRPRDCATKIGKDRGGLRGSCASKCYYYQVWGSRVKSKGVQKTYLEEIIQDCGRTDDNPNGGVISSDRTCEIKARLGTKRPASFAEIQECEYGRTLKGSYGQKYYYNDPTSNYRLLTSPFESKYQRAFQQRLVPFPYTGYSQRITGDNSVSSGWRHRPKSPVSRDGDTSQQILRSIRALGLRRSLQSYTHIIQPGIARENRLTAHALLLRLRRRRTPYRHPCGSYLIRRAAAASPKSLGSGDARREGGLRAADLALAQRRVVHERARGVRDRARLYVKGSSHDQDVVDGGSKDSREVLMESDYESWCGDAAAGKESRGMPQSPHMRAAVGGMSTMIGHMSARGPMLVRVVKERREGRLRLDQDELEENLRMARASRRAASV
ncbi:hypothetical protein B0H17DRAFT_1288610 [Mycena rosella]|uniref:Uncharacterized protein n=1 Tax=Mycena rosella TaxID=1033263 RepID=A0AAD7BKT5_MYCRO|nr:hypothetical protein B0H17DRAFT_1288610 [Mycena rosella]